ncbi:vitamin K epoxide reductase family protein [Pseudokineococcus marinus]|uniref:Vitamin K epoxide reductase family protein n=1 Tax=Pseudokineococcus marinus TaxID=351215 RepID=A0A849BRX6_9ACTN|nr:vitamin K epoxide reductase family protein [Pseudokineococcus marinus]NNH22276.1 vitamin K epoxide reductase family protein [Pseudokineococcus marinus]
MSATDQRAPGDRHDVEPYDEADDVEDGPLAPVVGDRRFGAWMLVTGAIGFVAAFVLTVERFELALDPSYVPSCSINPVLSCGSVMETEQAALLGFPNPLIGIASFAVLTTLGVVLLSGARLPRWVQLGVQVGVTAGTALVVWLISQSLYAIGALCPYCMVVWSVMIPLFWTTTARSLEQGAVPAPAGLARAVVDLRFPLIALSYAVVVVLVAVEFWDYWRTLLPFA